MDISHEKDSDRIWLASYPRSGNTFIRVLLAECFNIPVAAKWENNPSDIAINRLTGGKFATPRISRILKTHDLPSDGAKFIYLVRDGKSSIISYHHYLHDFTDKRPTLEDVISGDVDYGSWSDHFRGWNKHSDRSNGLILKFEDFTNDPSSALDLLSGFLNQSPIKPFTKTFSEMHEADPKFFRVGKNRSEEFTEDQAAMFELRHGDLMRELGYG